MKVLVDAAAAARAVRRPYSTVFRWGRTGLITRHGKDDEGRWLYDLAEVMAAAASSVAHSDVKPSGACTVQRREAFEPCGVPVDEDLPWKICTRHAQAIARAIGGAP